MGRSFRSWLPCWRMCGWGRGRGSARLPSTSTSAGAAGAGSAASGAERWGFKGSAASPRQAADVQHASAGSRALAGQPWALRGHRAATSSTSVADSDGNDLVEEESSGSVPLPNRAPFCGRGATRGPIAEQRTGGKTTASRLTGIGGSRQGKQAANGSG